MTENPEQSRAVLERLARVARSVDRCDREGGCRYLASVTVLQCLTGFDGAAELCDRILSRCENKQCWTLAPRARRTEAPRSRSPIPFRIEEARSRRQHRVAEAGIVPFPRAADLDRMSDGVGNFVERLPLRPGVLGRAEPLLALYDYWRELRCVTNGSFANVSAARLMGLGLIGRLHVVDVSSSDPADFRFDLLGYTIPLDYYPTPRAITPAVYAESVLTDYNTVRLTAAPRLQKLRGHLSGMVCHYTRLILPFFDERRLVSRLLVCVRLEQGDGTRLGRSS